MKKLVGILLGCLFVLSVAVSANADLITNGDFSEGYDGWIVLNKKDNFEILPGWGPYVDHLHFLNSGIGQRGRLLQKFFIPTGADGIKIRFDYKANFGESGNGDSWDPDIDPSSFFNALVNLDLNDEGLFKYKNREVILKTNKSTGWTTVNMYINFDGYVTDVDPTNAKLRFEWNEKSDWMSNAKLDNIVVCPY